MDLELLTFRSSVMKKIRTFFSEGGMASCAPKPYLELDTPALSPTLIPETCLEVFKTQYISPWTEQTTDLFLVPSPEVYIKPIIAQHKVNVFQLSKCYRNCESMGRIHSPEFTMLEYYTMNADYIESLEITERLFSFLLPPVTTEEDFYKSLRPPFLRLTMDEAFKQLAGFSITECFPANTEDYTDSKSMAEAVKKMAYHARQLGLTDPSPAPETEAFENWTLEEIYNLIFVHIVEPNLPKEKPVFLMDYPCFVSCLAQNLTNKGLHKTYQKNLWKERWELYGNGIELANCYSEETNPLEVKKYFEKEGKIKNQNARIPHTINQEYWKFFEDFPSCSGVAMGFDRLIAFLAGKKNIDGLLP